MMASALNSPESVSALLWSEVVEGLGFVMSQKSFVVVVVVFFVVVLKLAERLFMMNASLPLCGLTVAVDNAEDETHEQ